MQIDSDLTIFLSTLKLPCATIVLLNEFEQYCLKHPNYKQKELDVLLEINNKCFEQEYLEILKQIRRYKGNKLEQAANRIVEQATGAPLGKLEAQNSIEQIIHRVGIHMIEIYQLGDYEELKKMEQKAIFMFIEDKEQQDKGNGGKIQNNKQQLICKDKGENREKNRFQQRQNKKQVRENLQMMSMSNRNNEIKSIKNVQQKKFKNDIFAITPQPLPQSFKKVVLKTITDTLISGQQQIKERQKCFQNNIPQSLIYFLIKLQNAFIKQRPIQGDIIPAMINFFQNCYNSLSSKGHKNYCLVRRLFIKFVHNLQMKEALQIYLSIELQNLYYTSSFLQMLQSLPFSLQLSQISKGQKKQFLSAEQHVCSFIKQQMTILNNTQSIPMIKFIKLTPIRNRKSINLFFSGFLSKNSDPRTDWKDLVQQCSFAQTYDIDWECCSNSQIIKYILKQFLFSTLTRLNLAMLFVKITRLFKENPFQQARKNAQITGKLTADAIIEHFQGRCINLLAFSLGTQVIGHILLRLIDRNALHLINKVVLMGGTLDVKIIKKIIKQGQHIEWINCYCQRDSILKYLFFIFHPYINPVGNEPVPGMKNINLKEINGHLEYRDKMQYIAQQISFSAFI